MNLRSKWEFGEARECRRGLLCGMGISPEEQARPLIGVVNSWNEYNPGHVHLKALAERVKQGVRDAGGRSPRATRSPTRWRSPPRATSSTAW